MMTPTTKFQLSPGYLISFLIIAIPMIAWAFDFRFEGLGTVETVAVTMAKVGGFGGFAMFAWSLILSGRYKVFDTLFRGQDKVYIAHRVFAVLGLALLIIHPFALTLVRTVQANTQAAWEMWYQYDNLKVFLGVIALFGMISIILWTLSNKASYETFIRVHRLLGVLFFVGALHAFLAGSVLRGSEFLQVYMGVLSIAAVVTFIHYSVLGDILHIPLVYQVASIHELPGGILDVRLWPKYRHMNFRPGQYAYVQFDRWRHHGFHPFTIASAKRSSGLQFYVRTSGDFTAAMRDLKVGDVAKVKGAYGGFTFDAPKYHKQLWIAGGIGITPFLSKARSFQKARTWPEVELIYFVKDQTEAFAAEELQRIEHEVKAFNYTLVDEERFGRMNLHDLLEHFRGLDDCAIYICGPPKMLELYEQQAEELGLTNQLFYEEFTFK